MCGIRTISSLISIHAPREGSDWRSDLYSEGGLIFQSTLPARGATDPGKPDIDYTGISIHAPREGSDSGTVAKIQGQFIFQSTLPARGATLLSGSWEGAELISIHAPREGSDDLTGYNRQRQEISIHAPREGSDPGNLCPPGHNFYFNPRSPRGERPKSVTLRCTVWRDFNPRSPRGERPKLVSQFATVTDISIHAPREGSDYSAIFSDAVSGVFQSTLPARGATDNDPQKNESYTLFQSTLPARGATDDQGRLHKDTVISIHAPREGSDCALE